MTVSPLSRQARMLALIAATGGAYGAVASLANGAPESAILSKVTGLGWSWAALAIGAAAIATHARTRAALIVLLAAVVGYYVADLLRGVYTGPEFGDATVTIDPTDVPVTTSWDGLLADEVLWSTAAALVCRPLAAIGGALHRSDAAGLLARLTIPAGAAVEYLLLRLPGELAVQPNPVTVATYAIGGAAGVAVIGVMIARAVTRRDRYEWMAR